MPSKAPTKTGINTPDCHLCRALIAPEHSGVASNKEILKDAKLFIKLIIAIIHRGTDGDLDVVKNEKEERQRITEQKNRIRER